MFNLIQSVKKKIDLEFSRSKKFFSSWKTASSLLNIKSRKKFFLVKSAFSFLRFTDQPFFSMIFKLAPVHTKMLNGHLNCFIWTRLFIINFREKFVSSFDPVPGSKLIFYHWVNRTADKDGQLFWFFFCLISFE